MRNPLQEQLLKAGLVKKHKVAEAVREQARQRQGKAPPAAEQVNAQQLQAERAERDRRLAAEQKALARAKEQRAQIRQIVDTHKVKREGDIVYRFVDAGQMASVLVNELLRNQLAKGLLVIVRHEQGYELLPRAAAEMVYARDGEVVLDHARAKPAETNEALDEHYRQFVVPDDLIW